ncbi:MAG: hypothetical protein IPG91_14935 [Ideonella sp.]|nr:hypothetical protein [Ideonella sp.]
MRTTVKIAEDALLNARHLAHREQMPLGDSISELLRRGSTAAGAQAATRQQAPLCDRFALLPARDAVITPRHVRERI